jgi:hypothetical protein
MYFDFQEIDKYGRENKKFTLVIKVTEQSRIVSIG